MLSVETVAEARGSAEREIPLSPLQQRLWFGQQLDPDSPRYNQCAVVTPAEPLHAGALEQALNAVLHRHEALRTGFEIRDGGAVQRVQPRASLRLPVVDLGRLPADARESEARRIIAAEARRPFDLAAAPLLRAVLLRLGGGRERLILTFHHLVCDGFSHAILFRELRALYEAFATGAASPLPAPRARYSDVVERQIQALGSQRQDKQLAYWTGKLAGAARLELPADRPRSAMVAGSGGVFSFEIPTALIDQLRSLGRAERVSLFMAVLAAYQALLQRHSGEDDVVVGTAAASRPDLDARSAIGFFVNTLALRTRVEPRLTARELLARVRDTALGAFAHQDVPFDRVVRALGSTRDADGANLFDTFFIFETGVGEAGDGQGWQVGAITSGRSEFDLNLNAIDLQPGRGPLACFFEFSAERFERATVHRLARQLERLLAGIVQNVETRLRDLPLLSGEERRQVVAEWNATAEEYPRELCAHELVALQARRTPDAIAVSRGELQVSYGELMRRVERLAGHLRRLGVGPESRVGLCAERSVELVVGLLAVLHAGGAYVPIDPEYPRERVDYMLADSGVEIVLTQDRLAADWAEQTPVESGATAENLAYVLYTSGSTGKPKGVQIPHRSLVNFVLDMGQRLAMGAGERLLSVTSLSFDIFGLELFVPLSHGGQVRLASREATLDGALLASELATWQATAMQSTPATWRMLLAAGWEGDAELKLLCGGEALPGELAARLLTKGKVLWNLFGPTETTIWSAVQRVEAVREPMPIGRPIANTQLYVLDGHGEPSPVGVPGELSIGGDGLARGYLHRGDLTAERFVPDPFGESGERLYRTGDLARFLRDGTVEFLGRIDHQVKVRGFRIELGEIEAVLSRAPGIEQAVVVAREDRPGDRRLVAYVVGSDASGLREVAASKLPAYMVPSIFVNLSSLPLTPNGKVDRKALPAPGGDRPEVGREYVAPRTAAEHVLASIWSEVLGIDRFGVEDNFFALGGDSILTLKVIARARDAGYQIELRQIFKHQTVAELAQVAVASQRIEVTPLAQPFSLLPAELTCRLGVNDVEDAYPLSPMQQGLLFHSLYAPDAGLYVAQVGCRLGGLDVEAFKRAWQTLVDRHPILRTSFLWEGLEQPLQAVQRGVELSWQEEDWRGLDGVARLEAFLRADAARGFELGRAPLMRLALLRLDGDAYQLVWSHHHLLLDGWCTTLVFEELFALYESYRFGRSQQPSHRRPYRDYIAWLSNQDLANAEAFWREMLRGFAAPTPLSIDRPQDCEAPAREYDTVEERLSPELSFGLESLARRHNLTLNTVLQGAWALLLSRTSGESDVVFGATVSGRPAELAGVESMLGLFINTLPVRVRVSPGQQAAQYLREIQTQQAEARQHDHSPLVEVQGWSEVPRGTPLFESILVFENYPVDELVRRQAGRALGIDGLRMEIRNNLPLTLTVSPGRQLSLLVRYDCRRFAETAIRRLQGHLATLLAGLVSDPSVRLMDLPLLTDPERRMLTEWSAGEASEEPPICFHELFAQQVAAKPDALAAVYGDVQLSYAELDRRANQLAHHLVKLGVGPEARVGICLERSLDLLVAILATFKAGGAYVPLDPGNPPERLQIMLRDAEARVVLTREHLETEGPTVAPQTSVEPGNLAYVIYTSGSTGQPKGVAVEHRQLVSYVRGVTARLGLEPGRSYALISTPAADLGHTMLFPSLANGGCLHLIAEEMATDARALGQYFEEHRIDYLKIVPSHLQALHGADGAARIVPQRTLVLGGEAASPQWLAALRAQTVVFNHYGPTETTVGVLTCRVHEDLSSVPLGRPLADTQVHVLDAELGALPVGVAGELCIGGRGVSRGYLGRPELTAERFVPNPYGEAGSRLYRTGDLARRRADGQVEFLGRIDHQVKLRGFRIELGEIEAALCRQPGVNQAVVVLRDNALVAYVVGQADLDVLRASLAARLPDYMVPSWIVPLASLPLTSNGKLDRKALPAPEAPRTESVETAPQTAAEQALAAIWADVLGVERVGTTESFFELGGDSILCIQVIARAREAGYQLTLKQIFQHPTIAELARVAEQATVRQASPEPVGGPVPLTPIQHWFFEQQLPNPHHFNQAVLLKLREPVQVEALAAAVEKVVRHHDALRLRFERDGDGWRQWHAEAAAVLEQARELDPSQVQASLSLTAGPLLRAVLAGDRLLLVIHHLAVDGVSWRVLLEDLERAYRRKELPAKTTSFQEWSRRLSEHASFLEAEAAYWLNVQGAAPLPVDHHDGENTVGSARTVSVALSAEETRCLLQEVPGVYRTQINDVLLAALVQAVSAWTGSRRVLVELEGHGREELFADVDLSRTVGWLTSLYPVALEVAGNAGTLLKSIKEQLRAVPHRGIGYGLLRYLGPVETRAQLAALPRPEIRFNYLGQFDQVLEGSTLFAPAPESSGPSRDPQGQRRYLLDVLGRVADGRLQLDWGYSKALHERQTIAAVAESFLGSLRALIEHCRTAEAGGYTPSDFPLAALAQEQLDLCLAGDRDVEDVYPLSPMQQGLLLHSQDAPRSAVYFEQLSCRIAGGLDVQAFQRAWQALVDRHAVLRSRFVWEGLREPVQVVRRGAELRWDERDWRGHGRSEQAERLEAFLREDRERGFALADAPPLRLALLRLDSVVYHFVWSYHHVLLDGWSSAAVIKEVFVLYESFRRGEELALERPRPYRDYIAWLQAQGRQGAEAFWRRSLAGFTAPTRLEVQCAETVMEDGEHAVETLLLSREATAALDRLVRSRDLTLNTVLQGAWALLLSRYTGETDVLFGATVSGRPAELAGVDAMLGLFINTLPVRVSVPPELRVADYLRELQAQQVEARQYEFSPLSDVQGWSEVARGTSLFETLLVFENYPVDESLRAQPGEALGIGDVRRYQRTSYPLTLVAIPGAELLVRLEYDRSRFAAATVRGLARHLAGFLEAMAASPAARLMDLPLVGGEERQALLAAANARPGEGLEARCLHELYEEQADRRPDAVAVVCEGRQLSYRELDLRANQLANRLRRLGVGPEIRVALCLERSLEMVVAVLAVLKAGGTYVPLDPDQPRERLAWLLADSGVRVLLSQERLLDRLPAAIPLLCLDRDWSAIGCEEAISPRGGAEPDNAAYVIYTSGSTGRPKGVLVTHRNVARLLTATEEWFHFGPRDRWTLFHSYAFDFSVWEMWGALAYGGCLVIVPYLTSRSPEEFLGLLADEQVTVLNQTPSAFYELVRAELAASPRSRLALRQVVFGGEALDYRQLRPWLDRHGDAEPRLVNMYGITETTVHVSYRPVATADTERGPGGWIGGPIPDLSLHVLGDGLDPMPIGVAGELYVGGSGLARGYLGRPELTAERFLPDPFSGVAGARLYKTGDRGARLADGDVVYRGRGDAQVKIRGFRIEPGEIETALERHPAVGQAVVVVREDRPGEKRLVAYVVGKDGLTPEAAELRRFAAGRLPEHMVPAAFVTLDRLPLTTNGKLDRRGLPVPEGVRPDLGEAYAAPETTLERALAGIWTEVLGLDRVGIHDNFFALGGHSLLAAQVLSRVRAQLGVQMRLEHVFTRPTVARLAERIEVMGWMPPGSAPAVSEALEEGEI